MSIFSFWQIQYPDIGPTDAGDQSHQSTSGGLIEVRAKLCMDWTITEIVGT